MIFPARSTLFDDENVFRFLSVGVPRSMEENVPRKNIFDCCPTTSRGVCNPSATTNVESSYLVVHSIRLHFAVELR